MKFSDESQGTQDVITFIDPFVQVFQIFVGAATRLQGSFKVPMYFLLNRITSAHLINNTRTCILWYHNPPIFLNCAASSGSSADNKLMERYESEL
jgi:hypothetical protein